MLLRNFRAPPNTAFERMLTAKATISIKRVRRDQNGNPTFPRVDDYHLDAIRCNQVKGDQYAYFSSSEISQALLDHGICFLPKKGDLDKYFLQGHQIEEIYSKLTLSLLPCSLEDPTECVDEEIVRSTEYMLVSPSPDVDLSKADDFIKWNPLSGDILLLDTGSHQRFNSKFKKFSIFDKKSIFRDAVHRRDYFRIDQHYIYSFSRNESQIHCPPAVVEAGDKARCQPYAEMIFTSSDRQETITRLYPSFLRALSEIGGFSELIMVFIGVVYGIFNSWLCEMRKFLVKKVFGKEQESGSGDEKMKGYGRVVEDNLDLVEVMKELNGLRLLNRVIFKEHHLTLLPEVLRKIKDEESREEDNSTNKKNFGKDQTKKEEQNRDPFDNKISPTNSKKNKFYDKIQPFMRRE